MDAMYWVVGEPYAQMANVSAEQFRRVWPQSQIWVYTDDAKTPQLDRHDLYEVVEMGQIRHMRPMVANLYAQVDYCLTYLKNPTLFLDVDTLVLAPFTFDADLMVTWRDSSSAGVSEDLARLMPYNYGVIGAGSDVTATEAFIWMRQRCTEYHSGLQDWYGNQTALRELVGPQGETEIVLPSGPITVDQFPCAKYNYTPESADEDLEGKFIVHPKGDRKDMFFEIAERIKQ